MTVSTHKMVEPSAQTFPKYGEPESFEQALLTWHGDILMLTLATGEKVAGITEISGDLRTVYVDGDYTRGKLNDIDTHRVYRVSAIVGITFLRDQSSPEV